MSPSQITVALAQISYQIGTSFYLPYTAGALQAYLQQQGEASQRYRFLPLFYHYESLEAAQEHFAPADVIGLSLYVWNERRSLAIARMLKTHYPDKLIIAGGPQVPDRAQAYLAAHPYLDIVAHGPGEEILLQILTDYPHGNWQGIAGVSFFQAGVFYTTPKAPRSKNLTAYPSPYLQGVFDTLVTERGRWVATLESNRGCPFACTYCDWGSAIASKVYAFPTERVMADIRWIGKYKIEDVYLADANFGMLKADLELAKAVVAVYQETGYPRKFQTQTAKNITQRMIEAQKILVEGGLNTTAAISLQSVDPQTLKNIRRDNISLQTYQALQNFAVDVGLHAFTDIIIGLPGETYASFCQGLATVIEMGQHNRVLYHNAALLPNAEMAQPEYRQRYGIESIWVKMPGKLMHDGDLPELIEIVVATHAMPRADWKKTLVFAWTVNFLYYANKLLQVVFQVIHQQFKLDFITLFNAFLNPGPDFPVLTQTQKLLHQAVAAYQQGYAAGEQSASIWSLYEGEHMTPDLSLQFQLCDMGLVANFYAESGQLLFQLLHSLGLTPSQKMLSQSLAFNYQLFCHLLPQQHFPIPIQLPPPLPQSLRLNYNFQAFFEAYLRGQPIPLVETGAQTVDFEAYTITF